MKKLLVTIALGATFVSAPALAQQDSGGGGFMQRDQTRAEAQQRADMMFQMLDANKDGTVTKAEAEAALAQFQAARGGGDQAGGRGSGRMQRMLDQAFGTAQSLTQAQFDAGVLARFDAQDLNRDGTVTAAERQQLRAQGQAQGQAPAAPQAPAKPQ
jgi:Ca2+-binding EF-hand superfamily protein